MDSRKVMEAYPCKTILNHLKEDRGPIYRLRIGLPYNYEEACSFCEKEKPILQLRYHNRGDLRSSVIMIGSQEYKKGILWPLEDPLKKKAGRLCHLLTNARVLMDGVDLLNELLFKTYQAIHFTTTRFDGVTRILDLSPPSSAAPKTLLDMRIKRGTILIPATSSIENGCVIKRAARCGREILAIKRPILEEVLLITEGEKVSLFLQGIREDLFYNETKWWDNGGKEFLGQGRYLDLSSLGVGSHHIVSRVEGSGLSDVAIITVVIRPKTRIEDSLLVRAKQKGPIQGKEEFDIFLDLSKKIDLYAGKKGVKDFYRITKMVGKLEIELKVRIVGRYLRQGEYLERLDPALLNPFFMAIDGLLRRNKQETVRFLKATERLFEGSRKGQDIRRDVAHLLDSVNNFVKNDFSEEDLKDLFTRVPLEESDHEWLGDLYKKQGLYEYALDEMKLSERKLEERFKLFIKEIPDGTKKSRQKGRYIKIEVLNPRSGKYEALKAKIYPKKEGDFMIVPPKLSSDYFNEDGNIRLHFLKES